MGKPSRDKGKRGEREVAHLFRLAGFVADRTRQSDGDVDPDVRVRLEDGSEMPIHVEVKRRKAIAAAQFLEQAQADCLASAADLDPVVFMRADSGAWQVVLDPDHFFRLLSLRWAR